jgi:hypothetical protein
LAAWAEGAAAFICTALIAFGILIIVLSHGFFMNLLGAGTAAAGGAAAYLSLRAEPSNRKPVDVWGRRLPLRAAPPRQSN